MSELTHYTSGLLGQVFLKDENNDVWAKMWDMDIVTARKRAALIVEAVNTCTALRAELEAVKAQRDKYRDVIDFIEENLVTYGTGYDIDNNEMGLEDKYGTCFSAYGANVFECVADARHTMKELEASE